MVTGLGPSTVVDTTNVDPCPSCGTTSGVQPITGMSPTVDACSCAACGTGWAVTVVSPRLFLERLTGTVELAAARSVLRGVITLADQAPALTDEQLRLRLVALAGVAARGFRCERIAPGPEGPLRGVRETPSRAHTMGIDCGEGHTYGP